MPHPLRFDTSRGNGRLTIAISGDLDMAGTFRLRFRLAIVRGTRDVQRVFELAGYEGVLPFVDDPAGL